MKHFKDINLGWAMGDFGSHADEAIWISEKLSTRVSFEFNGVRVCVTEKTTKEHLWEEYNIALKGDYDEAYGEGWGR